jgi:DNA-binding NarL/FixJ family response regulator
MKSNSMITKAACLMLMASATTSAFAQKMNIEHKGDTTIIKVEDPTKYLLLPIQEEKDEAQVLCCLVKCGLNTKECAVCKGVSLNAIRTQKSRIKSKLM